MFVYDVKSGNVTDVSMCVMLFRGGVSGRYNITGIDNRGNDHLVVDNIETVEKYHSIISEMLENLKLGIVAYTISEDI